MSFLDFINPFNKLLGVVSEAVEDRDKRNAINAEIEALRAQVYLAELGTHTIPWVDALHKMQRGILSVLSMAVTVYMVAQGVTDPLALGAAVGPASIYNVVKGKGR